MAEKTTIGKRLSSRFVAGMTVEDVLAATKAVNERGQSVSMDNLGENVTNAEEAKQSAQLYHQLLDQIAERKLNANVSMKLTHMGLDVDEKLAIEHHPRPGCARRQRSTTLFAWIWKAPPTRSAPSILSTNCTA